MAEENDKKDQDARSWGEKLREEFFGKKMQEKKSAEDLAKKLQKNPKRY